MATRSWGLLWWGLAAAVVIEAVGLPFACLFPSRDGSFGAPFPYVGPGPGWCTFGSERVDGASLLADLLVTTALVLPLGAALRRWRWIPLLTAPAAIVLAVRLWPGDIPLQGISMQMWIAGVAGYAIGALSVVLVTRWRVRVS